MVLAATSYLLNSAIHHSLHRGVVVEGTQGTHISGNVVYQTFGHGYYISRESKAIVDGNLGLGVQGGISSDPTDWTETATYWIGSPATRVVGNVAAGSDNKGILLAWGREEAEVGYGVVEGNTVHSSHHGLQLGRVGRGQGSWGNMVDGQEREVRLERSTCYRF